MKLLNKAATQAETGQFQDFANNSENLESYLKVLLDTKDRTDKLDAQLSLAKQSEKMAEQALIGKMLEQGVESFRGMGKTITRSESVFPSVLKENRDKQLEWLREVGAQSLITETVNANTFGSFIRNTFIEPKLEGQLPEWIKVYREPKLLIRTVAK